MVNPETHREELIHRIDELETLLAKKKKEAKHNNDAPRFRVGTDGIPVLLETVNSENQQSFSDPKNDQLINEIIDKIDMEITRDLDELILILKDNIINEVKVHLLKELVENKNSNLAK